MPNPVPDRARAATAALALLLLSTAPGARAQTAPASLGSALLSPFAERTSAPEAQAPKSPHAPVERDPPDLTMTLAAAAAGLVAAAWLMRRL